MRNRILTLIHRKRMFQIVSFTVGYNIGYKLRSKFIRKNYQRKLIRERKLKKRRARSKWIPLGLAFGLPELEWQPSELYYFFGLNKKLKNWHKKSLKKNVSGIRQSYKLFVLKNEKRKKKNACDTNQGCQTSPTQ